MPTSEETIGLVMRPSQPTLLAVSRALAGVPRVYVPNDIGRMIASGYQLHRVVPIDLFPQTYHVELVATLALPG